MPDIIHSQALPFKALGFKHRVGEPHFKYLFRGAPQTPNNYLFSLALQTSFYSPVHKHNFEQFRYAHKGSFSISPSLTIQQGEICYHPEGVEYGPQKDEGNNERVLLILQFGGMSGQGYLNYETLLGVQGKMIEARKGTFEGGRFWEVGEKERGGKGKDGFEAVWEECNGRPLVYPEPRYERPILMKPQNFGWMEVGEKAWRKHLGAFTERATRVEMVRVEEGGLLKMEGENATQLAFVVRGEGKLHGEMLAFEDAFRLMPGEGSVLSSDSRLEILRIVVPELDK